MISRFLKISFFKTIIFLIIFGIFLPVSPFFVLAQFNESSDISVGLLPSNPKPNQSVQITIESYSLNLNSSKISWYVNNKLVQQGVGIKTISTQAGMLGSETKVRVQVDTGTEVFTKNITILPTSVSILWEAKTYTPPFFKGKALFSHQSNILFTAIPRIVVNGKEVPKENLVYTWSKNGTILGDQNGYGKYTLPITGSVISRPLSIDVEVNDPNTGITAFNTIDVQPVEPEIVMYATDPLYGVEYNKTIKETFSLAGKEVTLTAVPYFFSTIDIGSGNISYNWSINGNTISDGQNTQTRVFRKVGDVFGLSNIGITINNDSKLLQFASYQLAIDFLKDRSE